ncbi:hypothetical protein, partial [Mycobacterium tuberculosis]|uniref:hypothetical protein n=1 Tax=Mycobacterium tuberculosis TaxID=1773 RepID=UPI00254FC691
VKAVDGTLKAQDQALGGTFDLAMDVHREASAATGQLQGFGPQETVAGRIDDVKKNSLMWDPGKEAYTAAKADSGQNRI